MASEGERTHCSRAWHAHDQDPHGPVLLDKLLYVLGAPVIYRHVESLYVVFLLKSKGRRLSFRVVPRSVLISLTRNVRRIGSEAQNAY